MKHTPVIRLANVRRAFELAQEACPHWDHEGHEAVAECCYVLDDARRAYRKARKTVN